MGSMVRPAPLSFSEDTNMFGGMIRSLYGAYLDEIIQRVSEDYDPYEYVEEDDAPEGGSDSELEEFDWSEK